MSTGLILLITLGAVFGGLLGLAARWLRSNDDPLVEALNRELPQTQCAQCGYPGCRPYAQALASGVAPINLCPPGGDATIARLAELMGTEPLPLDGALEAPPPDHVARIDEDWCVGCGLCLPACPVDAIVGAHPLMHTVIADVCTGCELCLDPCPMNCIDMVPRPAGQKESAPPRRPWARETRHAAGA